jgi:hypothetical protein
MTRTAPLVAIAMQSGHRVAIGAIDETARIKFWEPTDGKQVDEADLTSPLWKFVVSPSIE